MLRGIPKNRETIQISRIFHKNNQRIFADK
jgi:hypothetical protein